MLKLNSPNMSNIIKTATMMAKILKMLQDDPYPIPLFIHIDIGVFV